MFVTVMYKSTQNVGLKKNRNHIITQHLSLTTENNVARKEGVHAFISFLLVIVTIYLSWVCVILEVLWIYTKQF